VEIALKATRNEGDLCNLGIEFADATQDLGTCDSVTFSLFLKRSIIPANLL
jgi:hypothetical protein